MPWWLVAGSLLASSTSGATFFGMVSDYYRNGFHTHWIILGIAASWLVVCFLIGPRLRRFGGYTIPEYLAKRFDSPLLRPTFAVITIVWMLVLMSTVVVQGGLIFYGLWGWPYEISVTIMLVLIGIYTIVGGQTSVMLTDFVQLLIFVGATIILVPITVNAAGGWGHVADTVEVMQPGYFSPTGGVMTVMSAMSLFFIWFLGYLGHPGLLTRFYTARSEKEIYKTGIALSLFYLPFLGSMAVVGASLRVMYPNADDTEVLWIQFAVEHAPAILVGLLIAALAAAVLSTADTWLITASSSVTHDVARRFKKTDFTDRQLTRWTRWSVAILCLASLPIALARPGYIMEMMTVAYSVAGASGGIVIIISLYWRRMTKAAAWSGLLFGAGTAIIGRVAMYTVELPDWFDPILPTIVITGLIVVVVSLKTSNSLDADRAFDALTVRRGTQPEATSAAREG
jgi:SSS family transporter